MYNHKFSNDWHAWIPTNLGQLRFELFRKDNYSFLKYASIQADKDKIKYSNLDLSFISDSLFSKDEKYATGDVEIIYDNDSCKGTVEFRYKGILSIKSSVSIEPSGLTRIFSITSSTKHPELHQQISKDSNVEHLLAATIFNIIKPLAHYDGHHHQKIDTVLRVSKNKFDCLEQMKRFAQHLKEQEYTLKQLSGNQCLKSAGVLFESKGYLTYVKAFYENFCIDKKNESLTKCSYYLKAVERLVDSVEAKSEKRMLLHDYELKKNTILVTSIIFNITILFLFVRFAWPELLKNYETLSLYVLVSILTGLIFVTKIFLRPYENYKQFSKNYSNYEKRIFSSYAAISWSKSLFIDKIFINLMLIFIGIFFFYLLFTDKVSVIYHYLFSS